MSQDRNNFQAIGTARAASSNDGMVGRKVRCAIYTRKSSEEGLDQEFNSLDAQREACEAYIASQKHEGWVLMKDHYDDGGLSGGNMDRPALQQLLEAIDDGLVDQIVVYKVDRLTRSLPDFSRLIERLDKAKASFVSVTQSFNTATSMGRLTLNVLLSFAQFEREVTAERIRDKIAASKKKGMWMGGPVPLGYDAKDRMLIAKEDEASIVRQIYDLYLEHGTVRATKLEVDGCGLRSKQWTTKTGRERGGLLFTRGHLYRILTNPIYVGRVHHKGAIYDGQHNGIVDPDIWQRVQDQLTIAETRKASQKHGQNVADAMIAFAAGEEGEPECADQRGDRSNAQLARNHNAGSITVKSCTSTEGPSAMKNSKPMPSPAKSKRAYRTMPSLLVGKMFDETGDRLTPSHANKKGRRYRYYVSNRLIARSGEREVSGGGDSKCGSDGGNNGDEGAGADKGGVRIGGWGLPAKTLECAVADAVMVWLNSPTLPAQLTHAASAEEQQHIQQQVSSLQRQISGDDNHIARIAPLIHRVDLRAGQLVIQLSAKAMGVTIGIDAHRFEPHAIVFKAGFKHRKRGVETKLLLGHTAPQIDTMLIRNVAQARSWYADLKAGHPLPSIAQSSGTTVHLINRILPLAFLSPSIVEAICTGRQPPELTSRKMRDITVPSDWAEQNQLFEIG